MTAVEFLQSQAERLKYLSPEIFELAKEMEKQQIIDAHISGYDSSGNSAVDYYDFYYGSKEKNEITNSDIKKEI